MTFLLLNQTFYPDVMATGQYLTELALRLVERGHQVTVVTSRRAYDHPETQFPQNETWRGIRIIRISSTGFGKGSKWRRAADFGTFLACCALHLACLPRQDVVVALTSPPLIAFLGAVLARLRRARFCYWVMDFNPDEAIAAGWLRPGSLSARLLESMSRFSLRHARKIIALDQFMLDRIMAKGISADKIAVIPPWSHDTEVRFDAEGREHFRKKHGLDGKFVVMYSGNHSPIHPLDTLLAAAGQLAHDPDIAFCFIGGGSEWRRIREKAEGRRQNEEAEIRGQRSEVASQSRKQKSEIRNQRAEVRDQGSEVRGQDAAGEYFSISAFPPSAVPSTLRSTASEDGLRRTGQHFSFSNITCLPYQPLEQLAASLSAADLHVVVMGNEFVGLVHPCKIYNVLSVAAPVLYIGPRPSHLSEILEGLNPEYPWAYAARGEIGRVVQEIERLRRLPRVPGRQAPGPLRARFSKEVLLPRLIAELEAG